MQRRQPPCPSGIPPIRGVTYKHNQDIFVGTGVLDCPCFGSSETAIPYNNPQMVFVGTEDSPIRWGKCLRSRQRGTGSVRVLDCPQITAIPQTHRQCNPIIQNVNGTRSHHNYSLFIIHYSLATPRALPQRTRMVQDARSFGVAGVCAYVEHRKTGKHKAKKPSMGSLAFDGSDIYKTKNAKNLNIAHNNYINMRSCAVIAPPYSSFHSSTGLPANRFLKIRRRNKNTV